MKKIFLILFLLPTFLFSQADVDFLPTTNNGELVHHSYYSLSYSEQHEQAEWVFYEIKKERILGLVSRSNNFRNDEMISTNLEALKDNTAKYLSASDLFYKKGVKESYTRSNGKEVLPNFSSLEESGHKKGGDFIFKKKYK